jgi:hypothetical protein
MSRISMAASKPPDSTAENVAKSLSGLVPDEGVVVERVVDDDVVVERRGHDVAGLGVEWRKLHDPVHGHVGHERRLAARTAHGDQAVAGERSAVMQELEGFGEGGDGGDAGEPVAREQGVVEVVGAGERTRVAHGHFRPLFGAAGLEHDDGFSRLHGLRGGGGEALDVLQALDVEADGADARLVEERIEQGRCVDAGLVAEAVDAGDGQGAAHHGEIYGHVAGLGDDGDAALARTKPVLVGPRGGLVEGVDVAVAVGAHDGHVAGRGDQFVLQRLTAPTDFGEARGIDDGAADAAAGEFGHHLDGELALEGDEGGVRGFGKLGDGLEASDAGKRVRGAG